MAGVTAQVLEAFRDLVRSLLAPYDYCAHVRYRVESIAGDDRLRLQVVKRGGPWPDILPISLMSGIPGGSGAPSLGSEVLVVFVERDPSLPVVTHFARPEADGFIPVSVALDASTLVRVGEHAASVELAAGSEALLTGFETARALRYGDTVLITGSVVPGGSGTVTGVISLPPPGGLVSKVKA